MSKLPKRSRCDRTLQEKLMILKYVEENPTVKKRRIAALFDIKPQTLSDLVKRSDKIHAQISNGDANAVRKRQRKCTYPDVDKALLLWYKQESHRNEFNLDGPAILNQANLLLASSSIGNAPVELISMSWVERWKRRHGISKIRKVDESSVPVAPISRSWIDRWKTQHGEISLPSERRKDHESAAAVTDTVNSPEWDTLQDILAGYHPENIFNAAETALLWLLRPDDTPGLSRSFCKRITVLVSSNMTGTEKLPLLIVGNRANPKVFRSLTLPVEYHFSRDACMTSGIFAQWLKNLDRRMRTEKRVIAMVLTNSPTHPAVELTNIKLFFPPHNSSFQFQPMNCGVIKNLKVHYRHTLALRVLENTEAEDRPFSWNLLDAIIALKHAWKRVSSQTVENCFKTAGFVIKGSNSLVEISLEEDEAMYHTIWDWLSLIYGDLVLNNWNEYVCVDNGIQTSAESNGEQSDEFTDGSFAGEEVDSDGESISDEPIPNLSDAYAAMRTLQRYGLANACSEMEDITFQLENLLTGQLRRSVHKTKISDLVPVSD